MTTPEQNQFTAYLEEIIKATKAGGITWQRSNPTTFYWSKSTNDTKARITLQRVDRREPARTPNGIRTIRRVTTYVFQAVDINANTEMLSVNSAESREYQEPLSNLYDAITGSISQKGLDFLRSLLDSQNT